MKPRDDRMLELEVHDTDTVGRHFVAPGDVVDQLLDHLEPPTLTAAGLELSPLFGVPLYRDTCPCASEADA